jgi:hypothetical protein
MIISLLYRRSMTVANIDKNNATLTERRYG